MKGNGDWLQTSGKPGGGAQVSLDSFPPQGGGGYLCSELGRQSAGWQMALMSLEEQQRAGRVT